MNIKRPVAIKSLAELYTLWDRLRDIPVNLNENSVPVIDEPFLDFAVGTPAEDIWHWFEAQNSDFIVGDVQQGIRCADPVTN